MTVKMNWNSIRDFIIESFVLETMENIICFHSAVHYKQEATLCAQWGKIYCKQNTKYMRTVVHKYLKYYLFSVEFVISK